MTTDTVQRPAGRPPELAAPFPGRFLSVTSFRRDGTGVATPLCFVADGTQLFAFTDRHSAEVRRIRRRPNVLVAPCRVNGRLRREPPAPRC